MLGCRPGHRCGLFHGIEDRILCSLTSFHDTLPSILDPVLLAPQNHMATKPLTQLAFSIFENPGVYTLLLGSGLSSAASIPTGWNITLDLIRRIALSQGVEDQADWASWYRETAGKEPNYSDLVNELGRSPQERRSILDRYIEPSEDDREEGRKSPTTAHHAIADLVRHGFIKVVITTNFDRLLENALRERGVEPTVVASEDAFEGAVPLTHAHCYLLKLHGDYKDARIRNTEAELADYPKLYNATLDRVFDEYGLVVCGWSGDWDDALRAAIARCPSRRYSTFWAVHGKPGAHASSLISQRRGQVLSIQDADSFFSQLRDQVEALAQTHRENPRSIELLVNTTKRFLSRPEFRIQLEDLLAAEVHALFDKLDALAFAMDVPFSAEEFKSRLDGYQGATESLARMLGVLGRWGTGDDLVRVVEIIRSAQRHADQQKAGNTVWRYLSSYPALLLVTHYGVGLVQARRWPELHEFLSEPINNRQDGGTTRIVEKLFLQWWDGYHRRELWQSLAGLKQDPTPLSEHIFQLIQSWGQSFVGVGDVEDLYETWEILGSLAFGEKYSLAEFQAAERSSGVHDRYLHTPVGRSVWHRQSRERIFERMQLAAPKSL